MNYVYLVSVTWVPYGKHEPRTEDLCVVIASNSTRAKVLALKHSQRAKDWDYIDLRAKRVDPLNYLNEGVILAQEGWQWDFEDFEAEVADLRRWLLYQ